MIEMNSRLWGHLYLAVVGTALLALVDFSIVHTNLTASLLSVGCLSPVCASCYLLPRFHNPTSVSHLQCLTPRKTMGIIRVSSHALRKLSASNRKACRSYSQPSQLLYKTQQPGVVIGQTQNQPSSWVIPAALAIVGLGLSTFSTQQLVSGCDTIKMLSSERTAKQ